MHMPSATLNHEHKYRYAVLAMFTMLLSGFAVDIYTPSLPAITSYFDVHKGQVQLSITTYLIGFAVTQLIAGSASESLGRKWPILLGFTAFIISCILTAHAQTIYQLQSLRFIQGVAVAFVNVPARAIISDLFTEAEFFKMMNYATIFWAIGPIVAPAIGGYLQQYIGWQASFYFLAIYSLLVLIANAILLPETIKHRHKFNTRYMLHCFKELLTSKDYVLGVLLIGLIYSTLILFGIIGPFLMQDVLHYSAIQFGHMALAAGFAWFIGNITNRTLSNIRIEIKSRTGLTFMLIIATVMLVLAIGRPINVYDILPPMLALFFVGGLIFPNYFAHNIALFQHISAQANGLMGAMLLFIAGIASSLGIVLKSHSQIPLTIAYLTIIVICLFCTVFIKHKQIQRK